MHKLSSTHDEEIKSLLLSNDVALRLGCSAQAVRIWARSGKLPYVETVRGVRLFREDDVAAFAEARKQRKDTRHVH
jgi:excisionase family DNA binding protein